MYNAKSLFLQTSRHFREASRRLHDAARQSKALQNGLDTLQSKLEHASETLNTPS